MKKLTLTQIKNITPTTKLTLEQFIQLFNDVDENNPNPLWDNFYLEEDKDGNQIITPRNDCTIY